MKVLLLTLFFISNQLFCMVQSELQRAQQTSLPRDEIINAASKQKYALDIPQLTQMYYFKTAEEINAEEQFLLTKKLTEWDTKVGEIETTLQKIDAIRTNFEKPFDQKKAIVDNIRETQLDIDKLDPTDLTQFTQLSSEKQRLELELAQLETTINKDVLPNINPLKNTYNNLEEELFTLFNEIAKET